jgi:hypothetical protein
MSRKCPYCGNYNGSEPPGYCTDECEVEHKGEMTRARREPTATERDRLCEVVVSACMEYRKANAPVERNAIVDRMIDHIVAIVAPTLRERQPAANDSREAST